ncbi:MAG TPA: tetratricopeptide repeat protein [Ignavibacteriaceae bacterium]|nr:tetratricopeptide repeat protein [Ignavibacteriaceae bacterium]
MMKFLLLIIAISMLIIFGCSSSHETTGSDEVIQNDEQLTEPVSSSDNKTKAMEFFINGSIYETKGDYANAVLEFQDALKYDTSAGIYYALAKNYFFLRKVPQSLQYAKKAVKLNSDQLEYQSLLADIFSYASQFDSAAVVLENMIEKDSTSLTSYYRLARIYEESKPLSAIKIYKKLLNFIGPDWNVLTNVANLYEKMGNLDEAANTVKELLKIDPGNNSLYKLLVGYYTKSKEYDKALDEINDLLELDPDDLEAREEKAQIYLYKDDWETAAKEYSFILNKPDVSLDTKIKIGRAYFVQSLKDSTLTGVTKDFFEKIDKDTTDWEVKMFLGAIAINEHNDSTAINYFKDVTKLAGWNAQGWIRLGGLYFDNKRYDEAVKVMDEAIQHFPDDFTVNLILGLSLAQSNRSSEAKPYLEKAVRINPSDITALSAYGFTLNQLKENDEAIKYINKALQIDPKNVSLLGTLGLIYDGQQDWTACDSVYEKALSIDSSNALVNNNYAYSLSERGIKLDEAFKMAQIALKAEPLNSSYLDTMGWIYFKLGKYEEAKEYIEKAIKVGGESSVMLEHLGDITFMLGNKDQAKKIWEKSFSLDSTNNRVKIKIEKGEI